MEEGGTVPLDVIEHFGLEEWDQVNSLTLRFKEDVIYMDEATKKLSLESYNEIWIFTKEVYYGLGQASFKIKVITKYDWDNKVEYQIEDDLTFLFHNILSINVEPSKKIYKYKEVK